MSVFNGLVQRGGGKIRALGRIKIWNHSCESGRANNGKSVIRPTVGQKVYVIVIFMMPFHNEIVPTVAVNVGNVKAAVFRHSPNAPAYPNTRHR